MEKRNTLSGMLGRDRRGTPQDQTAISDEHGADEATPVAAEPAGDDEPLLAEAVTTLERSVTGLRGLIGEDQLDLRARVSQLDERIVVLEHLVGRLVGATHVESSRRQPNVAEVEPEEGYARLERIAASGGKRAAAAQRKLGTEKARADSARQEQDAAAVRAHKTRRGRPPA